MALLVSTVIIQGCYRTSLHFNSQPVPPAAKLKRTYVIGLVELDGPINIDALCPQGVARIDQRLGPFSVLVAFLTFGIVEARSVDVICRPARGPGATGTRDIRPPPGTPMRKHASRFANPVPDRIIAQLPVRSAIMAQ